MNSRPVRVQRRRTKGWRMPPNTVIVTRPGIFGNPFTGADAGSAQAAVEQYRAWLMAPEQAGLLQLIRERLRGANLACYCRPGTPCHADVLLEIANGETPPEDKPAKEGEAKHAGHATRVGG
jgi:hypothetical protein